MTENNTPYRSPPEAPVTPEGPSEPMLPLLIGASIVGWIGLTGLTNAALSLLLRFSPGALPALTRVLEVAQFAVLALGLWFVYRKAPARKPSSSSAESVSRPTPAWLVFLLISAVFWAFLSLLALMHLTPDNLMGPELHRELLDWAARSPGNWWELLLGALGVMGVAELLLYVSIWSLDPEFSRRVLAHTDQSG